MQPSRDVSGFDSRVPVDAKAYPRLTASRIALTGEDVALFYKQFSKEAFWPIIFSFPSRAVFDADHWEHYLEINRLFAERVAQEAERNALVWVHEYNLWMVPGHLRQLRPDLRIAFFHHTSFPPADIFGVLPWRYEIVGSLLACDYVGFHVPRYVENFVDVVKSHGPARILGRRACAPRYVTYGCALGVEEYTQGLEVGGRRVGLGAHPVGVDVARIARLLAKERTRERIAALAEEIGERACIFSAERLDYVKGPLEKLQAFESLLEQHPELHGHIVLVSVVTPAAEGMEVYEQTRAEVDRAVGRINGRFGRIDWTPVRYFFRALPFEELLAYYAVTDVAWITPLRDGLNLVAKEFVATQDALDRSGVLVLSEFAGAAVELLGAVLTNPYDTTSMRDSLYRALTLSAEDRADRMRRLGDIVRTYDLQDWGRSFLDAAVEASEQGRRGDTRTAAR
jgi:glucosylglycerol-phosphate synthase